MGERGFIDQLRWRIPEYWTLALSAAAWITLAAQVGGHVHQHGAIPNWGHWMLMVAAMMLPLKIDGIRLTAERSLWARRQRAVAGYLVGYLSIWAFAGMPMAWAFSTFKISGRLDWRIGTGLGFLITTAWVVSPWKGLAARMCHRTVPLAPAGWQADWDCLNYGWMAGSVCAFNCWPLMLLCWLSDHSFVAMCCSFGLGWMDRHCPLDKRRSAILTLMLAGMFGMFSRIW